MLKKIDLWAIMINGNSVSIDYSDTNFELKFQNEQHKIELQTIHEIGLYKMDHMTHDTVILYFNTHEVVIEIPFEINIQEGDLSKNVYSITNYSWLCKVENSDGFIDWLASHLIEFDKKWLKCSEPLLDAPSHVINYKNASCSN